MYFFVLLQVENICIVSICLSLNHTFYPAVYVCLICFVLNLLIPEISFSEFYIYSMIAWHHIRIGHKLFWPLNHRHLNPPCNFLKVLINYYSRYISTIKVNKSSELVCLGWWEKCNPFVFIFQRAVKMKVLLWIQSLQGSDCVLHLLWMEQVSNIVVTEVN